MYHLINDGMKKINEWWQHIGLVFFVAAGNAGLALLLSFMIGLSYEIEVSLIVFTVLALWFGIRLRPR